MPEIIINSDYYHHTLFELDGTFECLWADYADDKVVMKFFLK